MDKKTIHQTWIEIDKNALSHNVAQYKQWLPEKTKIAAVVKANAYGHGLIEIGLLHEHNDNVTRLCVANSQEGITLRKAGITKPILVLGFINNSFQDVIENNLDITISDIATAQSLQQQAQAMNAIVQIHLKIDTGLSRLGIRPDEFESFIKEIKALPNINLQGICSHLIEASNQATVHQQEEILQKFKMKNIQFHTSNSHGSLHSKFEYDFARIGAGLYGYLPEADPELQKKLRPVLSLKTTIIGIKKVAIGDTVGYGKTFTALRETVVAILAMGYFEGMNPDLASFGKVIIKGKLAPIVGRINMNYFTVDITDIADVNLYDIATLLGCDGDQILTAYNWRTQAQKNVRIFLAQLNPLIPRKIIE